MHQVETSSLYLCVVALSSLMQSSSWSCFAMSCLRCSCTKGGNTRDRSLGSPTSSRS